jgi:hypothetical protein
LERRLTVLVRILYRKENTYLSRTEPSFATSPFRCVITAMAEVCGSNWQTVWRQEAVPRYSGHVHSRMILPRDPGGSSPKAPRITFSSADIWVSGLDKTKLLRRTLNGIKLLRKIIIALVLLMKQTSDGLL